jgi:4-hydroxy-2-oxoheptanedioate aldolase
MSYTLKKNPVKEAIQSGQAVCGIYVAIPSPVIVELAAQSGLDFIRIDASHSALDLYSTEHMIRAAETRGITPLVRVQNDPHKILSVLEMGAMGVIIPDVSTAEQARAAVNSTRFQPIGERAMFSAARASGYGAIGGAEFTQWSNEEVLLAIQIESAEAIDNLDEILSIPGIDMVLSGRGDLAQSLGVTGQKNHPLVLEAEEKIFSTARSKGIAISVNLDATSTNFAESVQNWIQKGAQAITFGHDLAIIRHTFENMVKTARR